MVSTRSQRKPETLTGKSTTKKSTTQPRRTTAQGKVQVGAIKVSTADEAERVEDDNVWEGFTKPREKRMKKTHKASATKKSGKNVRSAFSVPFDIQLEIFSWLGSKDLISLTRTSKVFRHTLMHHSTLRIWKLARENEGAPHPPPTLSEMQWAALLFGSTVCSKCGASGPYGIDFSILKRACTACNMSNLVSAVEFRKEYSNYDETILEMIPYTNLRSSSRGGARLGEFYWLDDIHAISKQWATYQDAIYRRVPGARRKAEEFHQARVDLVRGIAEGVKSCIDWKRDLHKRRIDEMHYQSRMRRRDEILKRFAGMGKEQDDIEVIVALALS